MLSLKEKKTFVFFFVSALSQTIKMDFGFLKYISNLYT